MPHHWRCLWPGLLDPEQPHLVHDLVVGNSVHWRELELDDLCPFQPKPFYNSVILEGGPECTE